jgi:hypoxia-inducible factor 1-alpha inhibitor (HIF hydroxylase)
VRGVPVVLSGGCPLIAGIAHWSVAHLAATLADEPAAVAHATWPVHYTPAGQPRVSRAYGHGVGEGGVCSMTMSDFEARLRHCESGSTGTQPHLYLQAVLASRKAPSRSMSEKISEISPEISTEIAPEISPEITPEIMPSRPLGKALGRDLEERIGWAWLRATCEAAGGLGGDREAFEACQLWASRGGLYTPCHFDGAHNFFCQLEGTKRFLLFAPSQGYRLYHYPVGHPMDNFAMASLERPDLARFPMLAQAEGHVALVQVR